MAELEVILYSYNVKYILFSFDVIFLIDYLLFIWLQHETSHLANVMHDMENDFEFAIGMVFSNELEAYHKYVAYAIGKGFGVRKGHTVKNRKGEVIRRTFLHNCEGHSVTPSDQEINLRGLKLDVGVLLISNLRLIMVSMRL